LLGSLRGGLLLGGGVGSGLFGGLGFGLRFRLGGLVRAGLAVAAL
jgi:hypothetical protein